MDFLPLDIYQTYLGSLAILASLSHAFGRPFLTDRGAYVFATTGLPSSQQQRAPASSQAPPLPAPLSRDPAKLDSLITDTRVELPAGRRDVSRVGSVSLARY